jgi:uncharacterized Ntn-hydrolase superfamily protein
MTFSLIGRGPDGQLGLAVASCVLGVGARCPGALPGRAVLSSQAYVNPHLAGDVLGRVAAGDDLGAAVAAVLAADPARELRQVVALGPDGSAVIHTGAEVDPWSGHRSGADCAAAGNLLAGPGVIDAVVEGFERDADASLPERLLRGIEAGDAAGGDRRGRQSAALLVHGPEAPSYVDLRVDDHPDPVAELRRLWALCTPPLLERAWRAASTRDLEPVEALRARQAQVRASLEPERIA